MIFQFFQVFDGHYARIVFYLFDRLLILRWCQKSVGEYHAFSYTFILNEALNWQVPAESDQLISDEKLVTMEFNKLPTVVIKQVIKLYSTFKE